MSEGKTITLTPAKGRPMLTWVGKKPLERVTAFPAQLIEQFNPTGESGQKGGLIFHGDNKDVLAWLLANDYRGKINLVYIDPPFDSGADYVRKAELRGMRWATKLDGEGYTLGEQIQYTDIWTNDSYLQFMYERLLLIKELLSKTGSILLHCDARRSHHLRCLMDEVFGSEDTFRNEIIWFYRRWPTNTPAFQTMHDNIFWYTNCADNSHTFHKLYEEASERTLSDYGGRRLTTVQTEDGSWVKRETENESPGVPMRDVWEISREHPRGHEHTDYPTQKPRELIERITIALSNPGDLVLDCFCGSGTTAAVAQKLGRHWIIADINKGAVQTASKRLQHTIQEQIEVERKERESASFLEPAGDVLPQAASHSFAIYRVNDYDLQIQHNEAVNLAIEHVGIVRLKGDPFFDGLYGASLVKIIPFNHPLTLLDLQLVQDELSKRSDDARDITLVCLGKETAIDPWLAEYNHCHPVNKIDVIELRTDPRYGKFFEHKPAWTQIEIARQDGQIVVEIAEFMSPTILERLEMDTDLFHARVTDWRAMVDTVLIDAAYDGQVFNVTLSDVPERKSDLVAGRYILPAPEGETAVAVKIIDMLGEEVLVVQKV